MTFRFLSKKRVAIPLSEGLIPTLFQHFPKPVTLTGVFNSYHQIWGSPGNDNKGCQVLSFIHKN